MAWRSQDRAPIRASRGAVDLSCSTAKLAIGPRLLYLGPPGGEVFDAQDLRVDDCPVTNGRADQLLAFSPKQLEQLAQNADEQDRRITRF